MSFLVNGSGLSIWQRPEQQSMTYGESDWRRF
jgi:hypothetical protein